MSGSIRFRIIIFLCLVSLALPQCAPAATPSPSNPPTSTSTATSKPLPSLLPTKVVPTWVKQTCPATVLAKKSIVKMEVASLVNLFELTLNTKYLYTVGANLKLVTTGEADVDFGAANKMTLYAPKNGVGLVSVKEWNGVKAVTILAGSAYVNEDPNEPHCRMEVTAAGAKLISTGTEYMIVVRPPTATGAGEVQIAVLSGSLQVTDANLATITTLVAGQANQEAVTLTNGIAGVPSALPDTRENLLQSIANGQDLFKNDLNLNNLLPVTLWHTYEFGSAEEVALIELISRARTAFPEASIELAQVPLNELRAKWENEMAAGAGPDLVLASNDLAADWARAGQLLALDELFADQLGDFSPTALAGATIDGQLFGIPDSFKVVALYYNASKLSPPPATADDLLALVKEGRRIVLNPNAYFTFGFFPAFGGRLLDETGRCVADTGGFADAMQFLVNLQQAGAMFVSDPSEADKLFQGGDADMIVNGPWALQMYREALGDSLGVTPLPVGPNGRPASPLVGVDGFFINANSANPGEAVALAQFLSSPDSAQLLADQAGHIPVRIDVKIGDPAISAFAESAANGYPVLQRPELRNFYAPFDAMINGALARQFLPVDAIANACAEMNKLNQK